MARTTTTSNATISEQWERAQTTRDASFGPYVSFFFYIFVFFLHTNDIFRYYWCCLKVWKNLIKPTTTISGPNDAIRVIWALSECFYIIIRYFLILNAIVNRFSNDRTQTTVSSPHHTNTTNSSSSRNSWDSRWQKNGVRDATRLEPLVRFSFFSFYYTNFYLCLDLWLHYEGYKDDNGPKRRVSRRLGPLSSL